VSEQENTNSEKIRQPKAKSARSIRTKQVVMLIGAVAFIVTSLLFVFVSLINIQGVTSHYPFIYMRSGYPKLHDVCLMQRYYTHDNKAIGRDTLPISLRDHRLLVDERIMPPYLVIWTEETINKHQYIDSNPILLVEMHDNFKGGLELSYNFNEKYEKLVFYYWAGFVVFGVLMVISLVVLIVGIFLPKHVEDVGERGGESWE
jgi:hypothetical protein